MKHFFGDVRFGLRLLRRSPGFAATLIAMLVVGIGATTAVFSLLETIVLRPLPYQDPAELSVVWSTWAERRGSMSVPDYVEMRSAPTFSGIAAVKSTSYSLAADREPASHVVAANVTGEFFRVMAQTALRGRLVEPDDDRVGAAPVCVISASLWRRQFGSDDATIGRALLLNGASYTVVGVAAEGFRFASPRSRGVDVWTPIALTPRWRRGLDDRGDHHLTVFGRRRPGVTDAQATADLSTIAKSLEVRFPEVNAKRGVRVEDMKAVMLGGTSESVWLLFVAVVLAFFVVCTNVANLLLARAMSRRFEMAARAALGATPARLRRQILTETVVVFALAAIGGTLLARVLVRVSEEQILRGVVTNLDIRLDGGALAFAVGLALVFGLVAGLVPAAEAARVAPQRVLQEGGARASSGRRATIARGGLVIVQIALAFALLAGSGLALRAFLKVADAPLGFRPDGVVTAWSRRPETNTDDQVRAFQRALLERLAREPGVVTASLATSPPLSSDRTMTSLNIDGRPPWPPGDAPHVEQVIVSPAYFEVLGLPTLRGRAFTAADVEAAQRVTVISESLARRYFASEDPIGKHIGGELEFEVVGVVGDVRSDHLLEGSVPMFYLPLLQHAEHSVAVVARATHPEALLDALPGIVAEVDPQQAISNRARMVDTVYESVGEERFVATLLAAFAGGAVVLAMFGLFGLVSYTTNQRAHELGIRLALGATPGRLVRLVMTSGVRLLGLGLAVGLAGAILAGRVVAARVAGADAFDPGVTLVILALLAVAGTLASLLPALRAARIPPAVVLRYE